MSNEMKTLPGLDALISLKGKRALITGAAAGIGKAIAYRFAEAGAALILVGRSGDNLAKTESELAGLGTQVSSHVVDVSNKSAIDDLWASLSGSEPDILVNNVGTYPLKHFVDVDEVFYQQVMKTNLDSVYWMCQHMIAGRMDQGGVIVNIGSTDGIRPFKEALSHYSISKAGVIALTKTLGKEYAKHGFRVNAIVPGAMRPADAKAVGKQLRKGGLGVVKTGLEYMQRIPAGRLGHSDEVARIALVLASDLASYVHGAVIPIDGGFLAT
ncbi:SDR family NAD(P)-dependent oxidoreductase [Candidatus Bipolaricaulota bacterium]